MLAAIRYNLARLADFAGRESCASFWPYAGAVFVAMILGAALVAAPELIDTAMRMQQHAVGFPALGPVDRDASPFGITLGGERLDLVRDVSLALDMLALASAVAAALLAAAIVRRLHDGDRSGRWALLPLPFLAVGLLAMGAFPDATHDPVTLSLFAILIANDVLYLAALGYLALLLSGAGTTTEKRFSAARPTS